MSDPKTFGQAVREARLAKGMSMGQLASSVERSTASVRRWERDEGVPSRGIIDELAAVLDLSDDDLALMERAPDQRIAPAPVTPTPVTPAPVTPAPATPAPATPAPATPAPVTPAPATPARVTPARVTPPPATPAPATSAPATPAPATPAPATPAPATPAPATPARVTPPPAIPAPQPGASQATQAAASRVTGSVAVAEPVPTGIKGWFAELYNPANPWLGYLRAALTVIVLIVLAWVLVWALTGLFGAVGEIWDGMWAEEA